MSLKAVFQRVVPVRWQRVGKKEPLSVVMLLRAPHVFRTEELQSAAERAWRVSFAGRRSESMHCVAQSGPTTLLKAGPHLLSFFHYAKPYIENHEENTSWLPLESQRRAWAEHAACVGVDYMNAKTDVELAYCVLAKLVAELVDENCSAIYMPRESSLIPNNGTLYSELQKIASSRESGV
jgi:hypothetical protein